MTPLVSVCLPAFNAERYVRSAVDSVLSQTHIDFELLALDDGSTDRTAEILKQLAKQDARIVVKSRPNRGLVSTLNELFDDARGMYIARMDADDLCRPERLAHQVAHLQSNPDCVAVGSRALFIDPDGLPLIDFIDWFTHEDIDAALLRPVIGILHPTALIRRSAIGPAGGAYRAEFPHAEDLDLFLRLAEIGRLYNLPEILLDYRCHLGSVSHLHTARQSEVARQAVEAALRRRGLPANDESNRLALAHSETHGELHRKWAWWALSSGHFKSARKHVALAIKTEPLCRENLKLAASVLRASFVPHR